MGDSVGSLCCSPHGRLYVEGDDPRAAAFREDPGAALLHLGAAEPPPEGLPPSFELARQWARRFVAALCALPELEGLRDRVEVAPPPADDVASLLLAAPPMTGGEYLSPAVLEGWWRELEAAFRAAIARHEGSVESWLAEYSPTWSVVGRVCFHLAENKANADFPFAFLATYAHRVSESARVQHRPLGQALTAYAGDRAALLRLLLPVQRAAERSATLRAIVDSGAIYQPLAWTPEDAHRFLLDVPAFEAAGVVVRVPDWWRARRPPRPEVTVTVGGRPASLLGADTVLDFSVGLTLDGEMVSAAEWAEIMASTGTLARVRGRWVEIDRDKLAEVLAHWEAVERSSKNGIDFIQGMRLLAGAGELGLDGARRPAIAEASAWSTIAAGPWLREALEGLRSPDGLAPVPELGGDLKAELRPYQQVGLRWLWLLDRLGLGACLADDMGLGKTIQVISLFLLMARSERRAPNLLVVPASLIANWTSELERFAPKLVAFVAHPSVTPTAELAAIQPGALPVADVVITSYGTLHRLSWLSEVRWGAVVLDEAQAIKNPGTRQTRAVKALDARTRIALTGTPIENRLGDLWSLFDFLCPGLLGSAKAFTTLSKRLGAGREDAYRPLRELVRPYILRRLKTDRRIITDLPDKTELRAYCPLTKLQAAHYQKAVEALAEQLTGADGMKRRGAILAALLRMKQICNHPSQWLGDGGYAPEQSGKLGRLTELAEEIASRQEKMLVFTQFREMTEPLARHLEGIFGRAGLVLHGDTPVKRRKVLVDEFQDELGPPFFVLSLKAGGTGLNLTAASHVVHFDRWWNPAVEDQATDRAYRIGQKRNVLVHKLVCRGTVEERIDALIASKRALSTEVLEGGGEVLLTELSDDALLRMVALDIHSALGDG